MAKTEVTSDMILGVVICGGQYEMNLKKNLHGNIQLGAFEELVLLAVARLGEISYGVSIWEAVETGRKAPIAIGAIYTTLDRLVQKGFITSRNGEATRERGGKSKKHYRMEQLGQVALEEANATRQRVGHIAHDVAVPTH